MVLARLKAYLDAVGLAKTARLMKSPQDEVPLEEFYDDYAESLLAKLCISATLQERDRLADLRSAVLDLDLGSFVRYRQGFEDVLSERSAVAPDDLYEQGRGQGRFWQAIELEKLPPPVPRMAHRA